MQNDFEKQARQKMDELKFAPSQPVWQNIEEAIRKKKERRRILFLLPLLFLLLGIWLFTGKEEKSNGIYETGIKNNGLPHALPKNNQTHISDDENVVVIKKESGNITQLNKKTIAFISPFTTTWKETTNKKQSSNNHKRLIELDQVSKELSAITEKSKSNTTIAESKNNSDLSESSSNTQSIIDTSKAIAQTETHETLTSKTDTTKITKPSGSKKWAFGVSINGGISGLNIKNNVASGTFSAQAVPGQSAISPAIQQTPDQSTSFGITFQIKKQLNDRLGITTGVGYQYYSNRISVGQQVRRDTSLSTNNSLVQTNQYYTTATGSTVTYSEYTNQYHFISIPVLLQYQLFKKMPLYVEGGLSIQQLISTNALLVADGNRQLYQNKDAFSKTLLFTQLGVHYQILKKESFNIDTGPVVHYSLSNIYKDVSTNGHLFSVGLEARIHFNKKK